MTFSCSRDRTARVSCLNRGHFEALTSNCSLAWLWSAGHFLSVHHRDKTFTYLDFTHLSSQKYLPCLVQWLTINTAVSAIAFFPYKNYIRKGLQYTLLQGYLFDTISVDLAQQDHHTCSLYSTYRWRLPQARVSCLPKPSSSSKHFINKVKFTVLLSWCILGMADVSVL